MFHDSCAVGDSALWFRCCNDRLCAGNGHGRAEGHAPATIEGYGPSSVIVCDQGGYCWHAQERYAYPPDANVEIHPYGWQWDNGAHYAWREHSGRGYWQGDQWQAF
jgi:hypothetical protein